MGPQIAITAPSGASLLPQHSPGAGKRTTGHGSCLQVRAEEPGWGAHGGLQRGTKSRMCRGTPRPATRGDHRRGGHGGSYRSSGADAKGEGTMGGSSRVATAALQPAKLAATAGTAPPHLPLGPHPRAAPATLLGRDPHSQLPAPPRPPLASRPPRRTPARAPTRTPLGSAPPGRNGGREGTHLSGRSGGGGGRASGEGRALAAAHLPLPAAREEGAGRGRRRSGAGARPPPTAPPGGQSRHCRGDAAVREPLSHRRTRRDAGTRGGRRCCREKEGDA